MSTSFMDMELDENLLNDCIDLTCFDNLSEMDPITATIQTGSIRDEIFSEGGSLCSCSESETNEVLTSPMNRRSWPLARFYPSSEAFYQHFPKYKEVEDLHQQEAKNSNVTTLGQTNHKTNGSKKAKKEKEVDYIEDDWDVSDSLGSVSAASDEDFVLEENSSRSSEEDNNYDLRHSERRARIRRSRRRTRHQVSMSLLDDDYAFLEPSDDGYSVESSHQVKRSRSRRIQISDEDNDLPDHPSSNHVESSKSFTLSDDLFDRPLETNQMEADANVAVPKEEEKNEMKTSAASSYALSRPTRKASRDDGSRRLTMTMRPSTSSVYDLYNMKVKGYEVSLTHERTTYVLSLSDVCFGYLQSKPALSKAGARISVCFCGMQANIRQAEFVFCQSGKYCNHFVHKHCVDNIYYVKMAHYALYFKDFVCSKCLESEPTRPLLTSAASSSSQRESRRHRPMKVVKAVTAPPPPPPPPPKPEPLKLLQVSSFVDSSQIARSTVLDDNDGVTYTVSLSNEYYGTMIMEPPLPAGKQRNLKLCFCQRSYGPRTEFLYCVKGLSCNHYVHPTCCKQLASKKLHVYFRNNYICDMCAVDLPTEESKTYWDETDFVEEGEEHKEVEEKKEADQEREELHCEVKEKTKEVEKDELVESQSFPEDDALEEEEESQPALLRVDSSSIASEDEGSVNSQEFVFIRKCMP